MCVCMHNDGNTYCQLECGNRKYASKTSERHKLSANARVRRTSRPQPRIEHPLQRKSNVKRMEGSKRANHRTLGPRNRSANQPTPDNDYSGVPTHTKSPSSSVSAVALPIVYCHPRYHVGDHPLHQYQYREPRYAVPQCRRSSDSLHHNLLISWRLLHSYTESPLISSRRRASLNHEPGPSIVCPPTSPDNGM